MITNNKTVLAVTAVIAIVALQAYALVSTKNTINQRLAALEQEIQSVHATSAAQATRMTSDLGVITDRIGITNHDLDDARRAAEQMKQELKQEQAKTAARFTTESQEHSKAVESVRQESAAKIAEVESQTNTQFGAVNGDVKTVKGDLDATRNDLAASRREMGDIRDSLGREIARNASEVATLRRRGERDYFEFDIPKTSAMHRVADVQLQLRKTDPKRQKYDLALQVDDSKVEKKGQVINEPMSFLVGRDRLRYELVVYAIDKDRIRGYVSTPKDKVLSAEGPVFRQ